MRDRPRVKMKTMTHNAKKSSGILFVEAAILLPFGIAMLLGIAYYSRLYLFRTTIANSASVIARAIQDQPSITTTDMGQVVSGAFSNLAGTTLTETTLGVRTFTTQPSSTTLESMTTSSVSSGGSRNTAYPHTTGGPGQPYWVGVVVKRDFPVAQFILGSSSAFTMKSYAVARVVSPFPAGVIMMWSGAVSTIPAGWQLCNGTNGTPDLRDRFIVGAGSGYAVSATGGASEVTLSEAQMPSHRHWYTAATGNDIWGTQGTASPIVHGNINELEQSGRPDGTRLRHFSQETGLRGGDQPHENRPPYYALAFIMKLP